MSAPVARYTVFPILEHAHPCKKCGHRPRKYEAPHREASDLQWRWAGCPCTQSELIPLGEDPTLVSAWEEVNRG